MVDASRVALVSGSSRGIGAATARELGRRGYHVVINYLRNADAAAQVVRGIEADGGSAQAVQADVCDEHAVDALIDGVHAEHGRLDVLVCNANTAPPPFGPLAAQPWSAFQDKIIGELAGVYFLTQRVLPIMRARHTGRIVYVSGTAADTVSGMIAHSTAQAALNAFGRQVAGELAGDAITVNTIAPGPVLTDATANVFDDDIRRYLGQRSLLGRIQGPDDIGRAIAALTDDAFGAVTGQLVRVDAGFELLTQQRDGLAARLGAA